jgi:hypothetical protein
VTELRERFRQDLGAATDAYRHPPKRKFRRLRKVIATKGKGFRALRTGQRLPGIHYGSKHPTAPGAPATPGTAIMRQAAKPKLPSAGFHTTASAPSGMGGRSQPFAIKKRWDVSKHPREHTGEFASKTGEKTGRFLAGGAGAVGGALIGLGMARGSGEEAGRRGSNLYHRLRRSPSWIGERAEMEGGRSAGLGHSYGHVAGAGLPGLGGALAGGAAGAGIDRYLRYRRAKKAGRLDVYRRLNESTSSRPTSHQQVKASTKRALSAGRRVHSVAETIMGKGRVMDEDLTKLGAETTGGDVTTPGSMTGGSATAKKMPRGGGSASTAPLASPSVGAVATGASAGGAPTAPSMAAPSYMQKVGPGAAAARAGIAMTRHLAHHALPKYFVIAGGAAGAKAGYEAARRVGGHIAERMVAANERLGMSPGFAPGGRPGIVRHGERVVHSLGARLTSRQKKILLGTVAGDDTMLCVASERVGGARLDQPGSGRPATPGPDSSRQHPAAAHGVIDAVRGAQGGRVASFPDCLFFRLGVPTQCTG